MIILCSIKTTHITIFVARSVVEGLAREEDWLPAKACDLLLKHFRAPLGGRFLMAQGAADDIYRLCI